MRYVEMSRDGAIVAGHLTSEEIFDWKQKGYVMKKAEKIDYDFIDNYKGRQAMVKEKKAVYNKAGIRIG